MRQAGRYLPEYLECKKKAGGFLKLCTTPELAAEITLQPIKRFDLDAVILFSDILTPLIPMGIDIEFTPVPIIKNPIRTEKDLKQLKIKPIAENLGYVGDAIKLILKDLPIEKCLIGFGGAPFTLACYLLKDKNDKDFSNLKKFCFSSNKNYFALIEKLEEMSIEYFKYQIDSGVEILQIFDSWAGIFNLSDYQKFILPSVKRIIKALKKHSKTPIIYYVSNGSHLVDALLETTADVLSLEWRMNIKEILKKIKDKNKKIILQGNLDPFHLFLLERNLKQEITKIVSFFENENFIFNLGHGVDKETPIDKIHFAINCIRSGR